MRIFALLVLFASLLAAAGCSLAPTAAESWDKDAFAGAEAKADSSLAARVCRAHGLGPDCDVCAAAGWYGDGACDDFCPVRDVDCAAPSAPPAPIASCDEGCSEDRLYGTWRTTLTADELPEGAPELFALKADGTALVVRAGAALPATWQAEWGWLTLNESDGAHRFRTTQSRNSLASVEVGSDSIPLNPVVSFASTRSVPALCESADDCQPQALPEPRMGGWSCEASACVFVPAPACTEAPETSSITAMSTTGAPSPRVGQSAVWTGSRLFVWGGRSVTAGNATPLGDGALYDPQTDTWTPVSSEGAPRARWGAASAWDGSNVYVVGGGEREAHYFTDGGIFDPAMNSWTPIQACTDCRGIGNLNQAIWTGTTLLAWAYVNRDMVAYDPRTSSWTRFTARPPGGYSYDGLAGAGASGWDGAGLVVATRVSNDRYGTRLLAGRFDVGTRTWTELSTARAGIPGYGVLAGDRLIGFSSFATAYDTVADMWRPIAQASQSRPYDAAVWTGRDVILCRGRYFNEDPLATVCARYTPATNTWAPERVLQAKSLQQESVVWAGDQLLIWGGEQRYSINGMEFSNLTNEGLAYRPPACR